MQATQVDYKSFFFASGGRKAGAARKPFAHAICGTAV